MFPLKPQHVGVAVISDGPEHKGSEIMLRVQLGLVLRPLEG
jgi:hypothetical protein